MDFQEIEVLGISSDVLDHEMNINRKKRINAFYDVKLSLFNFRNFAKIVSSRAYFFLKIGH